MMKRTTPAFRSLARRLTRRALLVTEMVSTGAVLHGDVLPPAADGPVAVQLGGSDPSELAAASRVAARLGYDEVDLNVGCPSERAGQGSFGACLMVHPDVVARGVAAMVAAVDVPVTVKCRIGVDDDRGTARLERIVAAVVDAGAARVAVHARTAWLRGLSPAENRDVPPLRHDEVHALAATRPDVAWVCNGGIADLDDARDHLRHVDGVMLGRSVWDRPALLADVDVVLHGDPGPPPRIVDVVADVVAGWAGPDGRIRPHDLQTLQGVLAARPGARAWRRELARLRVGGEITPGDVVRALLGVLDLAPAA